MNSRFSFKNIAVAVVVFILLIISGLVFRASRNENIDSLPEDGLLIDLGEQVRIISDDATPSLVGGIANFDTLSRDLFLFAKTGYSKYSQGYDGVIGFKTTKIKSENGVVHMEGIFGATNNKIVVDVIPLKHGRISSSITDLVTNLNIDNILPSNTVRNQFIGSLPIENPEYTIDYLEESDTFSVNVFNGTQNYKIASDKLKEGLQIQDLATEKTVFFGSSENFINNDY